MSLKDKVFLLAASLLGAWLIRLIGLTMTMHETGQVALSPRRDRDIKAIFAFWHSRLLMSTYFFRDCGIGVLVSLSRDGELISRVIERFGFLPIRGSASRGGSQALRQMMQTLKRGHTVAVTPDGPKGPREQVQEGILFLAQQSGLPIHPFTFNASRRLLFKSWDRFMLPLPFSRGVFVWGQPIRVPRNADAALREQKRRDLERELTRITDVAERYFDPTGA